VALLLPHHHPGLRSLLACPRAGRPGGRGESLNLLSRLLEIWSTPPPGARPCPGWLVVLFHLSNLVISACYLAIPGIVLYYWRYRRDGVSPVKLWLVIAFLPVQALSRLARVDGFAGVPFCLFAILDTVAAIVTVNSVVWLRPKILHVLRLPSREALHDLNDRLQTKVMEIEILRLEEREKNARLMVEVERARRATPDPSERSWVLARHHALDRIVEVINEGR
jgi:hypothetical protein